MKAFSSGRHLWRRVKLRVTGGLIHHRAASARFYRFARFWGLAWKSFSRNRGLLRASALAYSTLLALIPMLAVVLGITSSFLKSEGERQIDVFITRVVVSVMPRSMLRSNFGGAFAGLRPAATNAPSAETSGQASSASRTEGQKLQAANQRQAAIKARQELVRRIHQFIQNTQSGTLGVTGSVGLIITAILLLRQIESVFNDIWGVTQGRGWFAQTVLYWALISLAPLLVGLALGVVGGPYLSASRRLLTAMPFLGKLIFQVLSVLVLCLVFAVFYALIPNTKVRWSAALIGGVVGGALWYLNNLISILYVSQVVSSSKIYGSLGLVPVFMLGLYLGWLILLFGAQVAYAFQNRTAYTEEEQKEVLDERSRELVALRLMKEVAVRFLQGGPAPNLSQLSHKGGVPTRLVQELMRTLCLAHLVSEVAGSEAAYLPARPLESMTYYDVLLAVRTTHGRHLATTRQRGDRRLDDEFRRIEEAERQVAGSLSFRVLAEAHLSGEPAPGSETGNVATSKQSARGKSPAGGEEELAA